MPRKKGTPWTIDLTGQKFNQWLVIKRICGSTWECQCSCGTIKGVTSSSLKLNTSKSCGCTAKDWCKTHGMIKTPVYYCWSAMIQRCDNPNNKFYHRYGGRGIKVCDSWYRFETFYADMGDKPEGGSLERIDNNLGYNPNNCIWADQKQQIRNREKTTYLEYKGERKPLAEWAEIYGINRKKLAERIRRNWPVEKALLQGKSGRWGVLKK